MNEPVPFRMSLAQERRLEANSEHVDKLDIFDPELGYLDKELILERMRTDPAYYFEKVAGLPRDMAKLVATAPKDISPAAFSGIRLNPFMGHGKDRTLEMVMHILGDHHTASIPSGGPLEADVLKAAIRRNLLAREAMKKRKFESIADIVKRAGLDDYIDLNYTTYKARDKIRNRRRIKRRGRKN